MLPCWGGQRRALWPGLGQEALSRKELRRRGGRGRRGDNHTQVHQAVGGWGAGGLWRAAGAEEPGSDEGRQEGWEWSVVLFSRSSGAAAGWKGRRAGWWPGPEGSRAAAREEG